METRKSQSVMTLLLAMLFVFVGLSGETRAQTELFSNVDLATSAKIKQEKGEILKNRDGLKRYRLVSLNNVSDLHQPAIVLNLFSDKRIKINREKMVEYETMEGWLGKIENDPRSSVTIYFKDKWISGRISSNGELYTFDTDENGVITILDIDESKLGQEIEVIEIRQ
jgi:hypothetical protein